MPDNRLRPDMVNLLVEEALQAIKHQAVNASSAEIFSAMVTLSLCAVKAAVSMGIPLDGLKAAVAGIYAVFPAEEKVN